MKSLPIFVLILATPFWLFSQMDNSHCAAESVYWELGPNYDIVWKVGSEKKLPHGGNFEMSGARIQAKVDYLIDQNKQLQLSKELRLPGLLNSTEVHSIADEGLPEVILNDVLISNAPIAEVSIDGNISFLHQTVQGISIQRKLFPSPSQELLVEYWELRNVGPVSRTLSFKQENFQRELIKGKASLYQLEVTSDVRPDITLHPNGLYRFALYYIIKKTGKAPPVKDAEFALMERSAFLQEAGEQAGLLCPEPLFNIAFDLAKIKAAEKALSSKTNTNSICAIFEKMYDFPLWTINQAVPYVQAISILEDLNASGPASAASDLKDFTCSHLLGKQAAAFPDAFYTQATGSQALFCRLFTEGFFGLSTTDQYGVIRCRPRMPSGWREMELQNINVFDTSVTLQLTKSRRYRGMYYFSVVKEGRVLIRRRIQSGRSIKVYVGEER